MQEVVKTIQKITASTFIQNDLIVILWKQEVHIKT